MVRKKFVSDRLIHCACGCGELIPDRDSRGNPVKYKLYHVLRMINSRPVSETTRKKLSEMRQGDKHWNFKGGKSNTKVGYIYVSAKDHPKVDPRGYVAEHRLVWEKYNKACLLTWGHVHHKNKKEYDNRIENLEGVSKFNHYKFHKKDMSNRRCYQCNRNKSRMYKGSPMWYKHKIMLGEFLCKLCYDINRIKSKRKIKK